MWVFGKLHTLRESLRDAPRCFATLLRPTFSFIDTATPGESLRRLPGSCSAEQVDREQFRLTFFRQFAKLYAVKIAGL
jgi:hypothetical protein